MLPRGKWPAAREVVQRLNVPLGALFCSVCHSRTDKLFICTAKKACRGPRRLLLGHSWVDGSVILNLFTEELIPNLWFVIDS